MRKEKIFKNLINIFKIFEQKEDFECGLSQSESQIHDLEAKLNLKFPESYKNFLRRYGYMSWFGGGIFGPSHDEYYDLLIRNKEARAEKLPQGFNYPPADAFLINDYGEAYFVIFSDNSPRSGQVGLFLSETGYQEEQAWDSFEAFLEYYYCS